MNGPNYLFVFLKKKLYNVEKRVSDVGIYGRGPSVPQGCGMSLYSIFWAFLVVKRSNHEVE
jgi:hypothetical protein